MDGGEHGVKWVQVTRVSIWQNGRFRSPQEHIRTEAKGLKKKKGGSSQRVSKAQNKILSRKRRTQLFQTPLLSFVIAKYSKLRRFMEENAAQPVAFSERTCTKRVGQPGTMAMRRIGCNETSI